MREVSRLAESQIPAQLATSVLDQRRVLVVDDTPDNSLLISMYLKNSGCILEFASNGQEAVATYMEFQPDLVLMDLKMPCMDGFSATSWIRLLEKRSGSRAVILALTAFSVKREELKCIEAGCDGVLSKPIRRSDLIQAMSYFLTH